jgi:hypothetical protein
VATEIVAIPTRILRFKAGPKSKQGAKLSASYKPLARTEDWLREFEPDNSQIGLQSKGLQTILPTRYIGPLTYQEYRDLELGLIPLTAVVTVVDAVELADKPVSKFIGPREDAIMLRASEPLTDEMRHALILDGQQIKPLARA